MSGLTKAGLVLGAVALVAALVGGATTSRVLAQDPEIAVGSAEIGVGEVEEIAVQALDMPSPGLAAWSLNVSFDPAVVEAVDCSPSSGSVCNPEFAADTVRITGATASGLEGDSLLATIDFACLAEGGSILEVTIDTLADGTPGDPQPIDALASNGSIACVENGGPPPPPAGGQGFPAAGGTYVGSVPGEGTVTLVISPDGQGISSISISNLVTVCGTINHVVTYDPPLDIQEPGFSFGLGTFSEGSATLSIEGFFAEDGTIPVNLIINTSNVDFPGGASPCLSQNQVIPLVLVRQTGGGAPPPPPPPSGGGRAPGGGLPDAGNGGFRFDSQNPVTWLVAGMVGAGLAWLAAGLAGAGLASTAGAVAQRTSGFLPRMKPLGNQPRARRQDAAVATAPRVETLAAPNAPRSGLRLQPPIDRVDVQEFRPPRRPDRPS